MAPDWAGLDSIPVTIYIDLGNDGTIDDSMMVNNELTGIEDAPFGSAQGDGALPTSFALLQNYPNPFNPSTTIRFGLPEAATVSLDIFDVLGRRVVGALREAPLQAGRHQYVWDGRDDLGMPAASGVYLYRIEADGFVQTRKMLLVR